MVFNPGAGLICLVMTIALTLTIRKCVKHRKKYSMLYATFFFLALTFLYVVPCIYILLTSEPVHFVRSFFAQSLLGIVSDLSLVFMWYAIVLRPLLLSLRYWSRFGKM